MVTIPADAGALGVLAAVLTWALYELRARRINQEKEIDASLDLRWREIRLRKKEVRAQQVQARSLAAIADALSGNGRLLEEEVEQDLEEPGTIEDVKPDNPLT